MIFLATRGLAFDGLDLAFFEVLDRKAFPYLTTAFMVFVGLLLTIFLESAMVYSIVPVLFFLWIPRNFLPSFTVAFMVLDFVLVFLASTAFFAIFLNNIRGNKNILHLRSCSLLQVGGGDPREVPLVGVAMQLLQDVRVLDVEWQRIYQNVVGLVPQDRSRHRLLPPFVVVEGLTGVSPDTV